MYRPLGERLLLISAIACGYFLVSCHRTAALPEIGGEQSAAARYGAASIKGPPAPYDCEPVDSIATPEARKLLRTLCRVSGNSILSGQHNFTNFPFRDTDKVHAMTERYPAIWSSDFGFTWGEDKDSIVHRNQMIEEAKRQWTAGSIVMLSWHQVRPTDVEPVEPVIGFECSVKGKLSDNEWSQLMTPGTLLRNRWLHSIDTVAFYLKQLQDANVPVLWRPLHESNGNFFWWGGRPGPDGTQQLFRDMFNRLTNVDHVHNLIWVWDQNVPGGRFADYFPGQRYVDALACDNYGKLLAAYYFSMLKIADGKPIAIGELGEPLTPQLLRSQPRWAWFLVWAGWENEKLIAIYSNPRTVNRGDPRLRDGSETF